MILWQKDFETGSEKLDKQHQLLIQNINLLEELLHTTNPTMSDVKFMAHLVDYLEAYANFHFKNEEGCMESHRCPVHGLNKQEHEKFQGFIHDYKRLCELQGFKLDLLQNLHAVMSKWITDHILKIDTQLKPCVLHQWFDLPILKPPDVERKLKALEPKPAAAPKPWLPTVDGKIESAVGAAYL